jgi:hypothetical protein
MYFKCFEFEFRKEEISPSNCVEKLKTKGGFGYSVEEEIKFIASHFHEIDTEQLKELKVETIESIVSHEDLCLSDEESLLDFIVSLGEEYAFLLRYVECCFLSLDGIKDFISRVDETRIDGRLWSSLCRRLCCELSDRKLSNPRFAKVNNKKDYSYTDGHSFEGIIHAMTKECGGNVHRKGVVTITSSGDGWNKPFQVADHGWDNYWNSQNGPNSWICFDFKERSVALSHYTLKSHSGTGHFFLAWVIEGSNDSSNWTTLDTRNTHSLNGPNIVETYKCSNDDCSEFFRYIRMRQTGKTSHNGDYLILANIEFFGRVGESSA